MAYPDGLTRAELVLGISIIVSGSLCAVISARFYLGKQRRANQPARSASLNISAYSVNRLPQALHWELVPAITALGKWQGVLIGRNLRYLKEK